MAMIYSSDRHGAQLICVAEARHGRRRGRGRISRCLISFALQKEGDGKLSFVDSFCSKKQIERKAEGARLDIKKEKVSSLGHEHDESKAPATPSPRFWDPSSSYWKRQNEMNNREANGGRRDI
jgi:hypothetical protein